MVAYTSFAVVGAGSLGSHVVNELLRQNVSIKVLTRDDTKPEFAAFKKNGASIVKADYSNEEELKQVLTDVEVVYVMANLVVRERHWQLSLNVQVPIAKAAGVQLFVPAEYGIYVTEGFTHHKKVVQDALKEPNLPYTVFYTGSFAEGFHGILEFDYANGKIQAVGGGGVAFSTTSRPDIARFVVRALTTAESSDLEWAKIPIEGDRKTHKEIAAIAEKKFGKPITIEYVDVEETRKEFSTNIVAFFTTVIADGNAVSGPETNVRAATAKFYPDWNPTPLNESITI